MLFAQYSATVRGEREISTRCCGKAGREFNWVARNCIRQRHSNSSREPRLSAQFHQSCKNSVGPVLQFFQAQGSVLRLKQYAQQQRVGCRRLLFCHERSRGAGCLAFQECSSARRDSAICCQRTASGKVKEKSRTTAGKRDNSHAEGSCSGVERAALG